MRMEHAKRLLRDDRLSITEIAMMLGYSSLAHFSNRFRQIVGVSPKAWRGTFL
jgi:AraC-like DNA-binding protein